MDGRRGILSREEIPFPNVVSVVINRVNFDINFQIRKVDFDLNTAEYQIRRTTTTTTSTKTATTTNMRG